MSCALIAGAVASTNSPILVGGTAGAIGIGILLVSVGARGTVLVATAILLIGLPVPVPVRALCEMGLVAMAVWSTCRATIDSHWMRAGRIAYLVMAGLYLLLLFHPNVPSLTVGLQGVRGTIVAVSGLMLGLCLPGGRRKDSRWSTAQVVLWLLVAAGAASLIVHLLAPGFEAGLPRGADSATSSLGGETRMQGLLSGPFHVAMLGAFLALAGVWKLFLRHATGLPIFGLGMALLLLAKVRTGLIAWALGLILLVALSIYLRNRFPGLMKMLRPPSVKSFLVGVAIIVGFTAVAFAAQDNVAVQQLQGIENDHRVADRRSSLDIALDMSRDSPLIGWGPGSASSGLGDEFAGKGLSHVTPHNGALELVVEAGIGALICFLIISASAVAQLWRQIRFEPDPSRDGLAIAAIAAIGGFWAFGDGLAATPISFCVAMILGASLSPLGDYINR